MDRLARERLTARVTVAKAVYAVRFPWAIRGIHSVSIHRRATIWLVGFAAFLTLNHHLGPHSDLHRAVFADHTVSHHDDGSDSPSHEDADPMCGQALLPDSCDLTPAAVEAEPHADHTSLGAATSYSLHPNDRAPPDLVADLQVNRV